MPLTMISSPLLMYLRPYEPATRLIDSVVPRVKMICRLRGALMKLRTFSRAPS